MFKSSENGSVFSYILTVSLLYIVMNHLIFDITHISEGEYLFLLIVNLSVPVIFSMALENSDNLALKIGKHFSILLLCLWVIFYEFFIAQVYTTKIVGISMFIGGNSLMFLLTKGAWPFNTENGKLFLERHKTYSFILMILLFVLLVISVSIIFFGEWGFRG